MRIMVFCTEGTKANTQRLTGRCFFHLNSDGVPVAAKQRGQSVPCSTETGKRNEIDFYKSSDFQFQYSNLSWKAKCGKKGAQERPPITSAVRHSPSVAVPDAGAKKTRARAHRMKKDLKKLEKQRHKEEAPDTLFPALEVLFDPQGLAERLFSSLQVAGVLCQPVPQFDD